MNQTFCNHKWEHLNPSTLNYTTWICSLCGEMLFGTTKTTKSPTTTTINTTTSSIRSYLVIGEECTDKFIYGSANRLSPEAPVPVFLPENIITNKGMAGNVSENLKAILEKYENSSTTYEYFSKENMTKTRYVDAKSNHIFLRVDENDKAKRITFNAELLQMIKSSETIIISDYNKGFLNIEDIEKIISLAPTKSTVILDTKKILNNKILDKIDFIKFNESEYERNLDKIPTAIKLFSRKIIVTLGGGGAKHKNVVYGVERKETIDVSGAGDTFLAAFSYFYSKSNKVPDSIKFANEIASIVVTKKGVSKI